MPRVLVIDDEKSITNMLTIALGRAGFKVDVASNGKEGVYKFNEMYFDAVITDMRMSGKNGNEVVHDIKNSNRPNTPVIGMSGTPWELLNEKFDAVLPKPFSLKALISTIQDVCYNSL
jgi:DNA-binding response OmpR family regulator